MDRTSCAIINSTAEELRLQEDQSISFVEVRDEAELLKTLQQTRVDVLLLSGDIIISEVQLPTIKDAELSSYIHKEAALIALGHTKERVVVCTEPQTANEFYQTNIPYSYVLVADLDVSVQDLIEIHQPEVVISKNAKLSFEKVAVCSSPISLQAVKAAEQITLFHRQFAQQDEFFARFSSSLSHDLPAPVRRISSFLGFFREDYENLLDDDGKMILDRLDSSTSDVKDLCAELVSFLRAGLSLNLEKVSFKELMKERAQEFNGPDADLYLDRERFHDAFDKIMENTIKNKDGERELLVNISTSKVAGKLLIAIKDNGAGVDPRYLKELFYPMRRMSVAGRFGMGLAFCHQYFRSIGGDIWATTEQENFFCLHIELPEA